MSDLIERQREIVARHIRGENEHDWDAVYDTFFQDGRAHYAVVPLRAVFRVVLTVSLLLTLSAAPFAASPRQKVSQDSASVTINPTEVTLHVREKQIFEAVVKGTQSSGIRWVVQERNGGHISEDGTYTAPRYVGLYHVVATSEENPAAKAVAKVTVVTEYDTPDAQKRR